jgi:histidine triad (HIT) family protein
MTNTSSIEMPNEDECAFCAYLQGKRPYTIVSRNELVATLVTKEQRGVPHLLVIPTHHRETILDITDEDACALMLGVRIAAKAIDKAYGRPGISIWQNNGISSNQTISHAHFHVAGTLDEGGTKWGEVKELSIAQTDAIAERLKPWL